MRSISTWMHFLGDNRPGWQCTGFLISWVYLWDSTESTLGSKSQTREGASSSLLKRRLNFNSWRKTKSENKNWKTLSPRFIFALFFWYTYLSFEYLQNDRYVCCLGATWSTGASLLPFFLDRVVKWRVKPDPPHSVCSSTAAFSHSWELNEFAEPIFCTILSAAVILTGEPDLNLFNPCSQTLRAPETGVYACMHFLRVFGCAPEKVAPSNV